MRENSHEEPGGLFRKFREWGRTTVPAPEEFQRFQALAGLLSPFPKDFSNAGMLNDLLNKTPKDITWPQLDAGHLALIGLMTEEMLRARFDSLAQEYETVTKRKPFAHGSFETPPTSLDGWRAGVLSLMEDLSKFRSAKKGFERVHSVLGLVFGIPLVGFIVAGCFYADFAFREISSPTTSWQPVLFCGVVGAGFSVLMRLYSLNWAPAIASHFKDLEALRRGLLIDCVLSIARGAVAAGLLYLLFASGLLESVLFPKFVEPTGEGLTVLKRFYSSNPASPEDVAKLLVWVFIAGFAERFVPDKLNRLVGEASTTNEKK